MISNCLDQLNANSWSLMGLMLLVQRWCFVNFFRSKQVALYAAIIAGMQYGS